MELRNHPWMVHYGIPNWPPAWTSANPGDDKPNLWGEIGVLKYVLGHPSENKCFLLIEHDGGKYIGALLFDENLFGRQICKLLQACTGAHD